MNCAQATHSLAMATSEQAPTEWEKAYLRFETSGQEIKKFRKRLKRVGALQWPRDSKVVELFCGRGNGLRALHSLGFKNVEGIDLSPQLVECYEGPGDLLVGDCRRLPFADASRDMLIVQGGLHHLPGLPTDLEQALKEAARVLRPGGVFVAVEPWLTPFLQMVHSACESKWARACFPRLDALATMIEHERTTYEQWLNQPDKILNALRSHFIVQAQTTRWGKLSFVGRKP